jgi:hypothetical protein
MNHLKIDVFEYPSSKFLGTRFAPFREFNLGEEIISNADEINGQVEEVMKLHNKKLSEIYYLTNKVK